MRFLLDEDLNPAIAEIGRGLSLGVTSVHEIGRRGFTDDEQLRFAASEERIFVTRNRDDFIRLTVAYYQEGSPHPGLLIVPYSLPNNRPERIARALLSWSKKAPGSAEALAYSIDFLSPPPILDP